jgi:hypothetical protein
VNYNNDIAYRVRETTLCLRLPGESVDPASATVSAAEIRAGISRRYADLLDSWVDLGRNRDRLELACALTHRGDLLQWNGYAAAWWWVLFELVDSRLGGQGGAWTGVQVESSGMPRRLVQRVFMARMGALQGGKGASFLPVFELGMLLSAGFVAGMAEYVAAWIAHRRTGRRLEARGGCLVLVFADEENTTKHVYRWMRSLQPGDHTPYVLGSPLRALRQRPEWAASSLPTLGEWMRALLPGWHSLRCYLGEAHGSAAMALGSDRAARRRILLTGSRLARQAVHAVRLKRCAALPETALFSLQGTEGLLLAVALEAAGVETVHWLHGILVSRRNLDGLAALAIAKCNADADELRRSGHYKRVINGESAVRQDALADGARGPARDGRTLLALTTLYHPTRVPFDELKLAEIREFLGTVSALARRLGCRVVWRPHPHEVKSDCAGLVAGSLDPALVTVDHGTPLDSQIASAEWVVTTVSGTILDVIAQGCVPAVYTGSFFEEVGLTNALPASLRFRDLAGGLQVMEHLAVPANRQQALAHLRRELSFDREYSPPQVSRAFVEGVEAAPAGLRK